MGSGGTWTRGWKRDQLKVIRWTNCIRPRKAPELNLDGGWRAVGDRWYCLPCSCSALVLLWPGLEMPGLQGLWPEGEGCTLRAHPCEHLQAGYISRKLSGWSHSLEPFLPKSASMDHPLWGEKGDCSSQLPPRPTSCLRIHCQGRACPRSDGCVTHWSQRRVCGSLASLLDSLGVFLLL